MVSITSSGALTNTRPESAPGYIFSNYDGSVSFPHIENRSLYLSTGKALVENPSYTVEFIDDKGLVSVSTNITTQGVVQSDYFVNAASGNDSSQGSFEVPFKTIGRAIQAVKNNSTNATQFAIYVDGSTTESLVIDTNKNILLSGYGSSGATIRASSGRVLHLRNANVTIDQNITLTGGNADNGGAVYVESGTLNINGATISGNKNGVNVAGGTININSGTIQNNDVGIHLAGGTVNLNGGAINVNSNYGVNVAGGTININSGTIQNNDVGIHLTSGMVNASGGTISGNTNGGVYVASGTTLNFTRNPIIKDNTKNGNANNVMYENEANLNILDSLASTAHIGITPVNTNPNTVVATGNGYTITESDKYKFISDIEDVEFIIKNNKIVVAAVQNYYVSSDTTIASDNNAGTQTKPFLTIQKAVDAIIAGAADVADDTIYNINIQNSLTESNIAIDSENLLNINLKASTSVTIDGNNENRILYIRGKGASVTIGNNITLKNGNSGGDNGGGVYIESGILNLTGATITSNSEGVYVEHGATLNVSGSTSVTGNTGDNIAYANGANIVIVDALSGAIGIKPHSTVTESIIVTGSTTYAITESDKARISFDSPYSALLHNLKLIESKNALVMLDIFTSGSNYYVSKDGDKDANGSENYPYNNVQAVLEDIRQSRSNAGTYIIHIKDNIAVEGTLGGGGDAIDNGFIEIQSSGVLNITLQGLGTGLNAGTLNASGNKRVLYIDGQNVSVILGNNLTLTGGSSDKGGGVFINSGSFIMTGGTITDNTVFHEGGHSNGGAVYVSGSLSSFTMKDGTIKNNKAIAGSRGAYAGGIYVEGAEFIMEGGTISENTSDKYAGGVYIADGTFNMSDGEIHSNSATESASGVLVGHPSTGNATFNMFGGSIKHNKTGGGQGGGVYVEQRGTLNLIGEVEITNNGINGSIDLSTGAWSGGKLNNVFFFNTTTSSTVKLNGNLDTDARIGLSPSTKDAGAILVEGVGRTFTVDNFPMDESLFSEKIGNNLTVFSSETIYLDGSSKGNDANRGDVYSAPVKTFQAALSRLTDSATSAIWITDTVTVADSQYWDGKPIGRNNTVVVKRYDGSMGGGSAFAGTLVNVTGGTLTLQNITLDGMGGVELDIDNNGMNEFDGEGSVSAKAPLINVTGGNVELASGAVLQNNNNISTAGGGIYFAGDKLTMIDSSEIQGNKASADNGNGGGVYVQSGSFNMTGGTIKTNSAQIDGGGIFINYGASVLLDGGTISGNKASVTVGCSGGAIFVEDGATLTMQSGSITGNEADNGGAIAINGDGIHTGGSTTTQRATFTMFNGVISDNTVLHAGGGDSKGGAVYVSGSLASFIMNGGSIEDNEAKTSSGNAYGGGVYVDSGEFKLQGSVDISNNTASSDGPNVFLVKDSANSAKVTLTGGITVTTPIGITPQTKHTTPDNNFVFGEVVVNRDVGYTGAIDTAWFKIEGNAKNDFNIYKNASGDDITLIAVYDTVYLRGDGNDNASGADNINAVATFDVALTRLKDIDGAVIKITGEVGVANTQTWDGKAGGRTHSATVHRAYTGGYSYLIRVTGGTLTLQNITIDGQGAVKFDFDGDGKNEFDGDGGYSDNISQLIYASGGNLTLNSNAFLQNNRGGGVYFSAINGTFTMSGGIIRGNIDSSGLDTGAGVYMSGYTSFVMSGGSIHWNKAERSGESASGGGLYFKGNGITMSGGEIYENIASGDMGNGGGVYIQGGTLTMSGKATIRKNRATHNGGGVYVDHGQGSDFTYAGTLSMSGSASIMDNSAITGAGVYINSNSDSDLRRHNVLNMNGGSITNNTATSTAGGVYANGGKLNLSGNPQVTGNNPNNIYLPDGKTITRTGSLEAAANDSIGVTVQAPQHEKQVATGVLSSEVSKFKSDTGEIFTLDASNNLLIDRNIGIPELTMNLGLNFEFTLTSSTPGVTFYWNAGIIGDSSPSFTWESVVEGELFTRAYSPPTVISYRIFVYAEKPGYVTTDTIRYDVTASGVVRVP